MRDSGATTTRTQDEHGVTPQEIFKLVEGGLAEVERELSRQATSNVELIERIGRYVQDSGGKRVRPALLLLTSRMCGYDGPICHRLGAVVELIHAATLVHDDIIDDAKVRRGRPSVNARWGNEITVLMGDWLYMTSFNLALSERHFKILDILTDVTRKMIEGELIQLSFNGSLDITEQQHLEISMRKTAFLFSACSRIGAILGAATDEQQEDLGRYGLSIGMAFQLVDDVLDFTSTESTLGKPVVSDLKEGKLTLPLIYIMREGEPAHRALVQTVLRENGFSSVGKETILDLVHRYRTVDRVLDKAQEYAETARRCLDGFPQSDARDALIEIPNYLIHRDR
jgi:octaprenyl-diphosphate synthase